MEIVINGDLAKNIFVLEDNEERINWFKQMFSYAPTLYITKDVPTANEILAEKKFDLIFLDHDLENISIYEEDSFVGYTGYDVAKELRDTINRDTECIIHSLNPTGSAQMIQAHPFNTTYIPFSMLKDSLRIQKSDEKSC